MSSEKPIANWKKQFNDIKIQLTKSNVAIMDDLWPYVERKINLDYHEVKLSLLRRWLIIHIPLAYISLIFLIFHVITAYSFMGEG